MKLMKDKRLIVYTDKQTFASKLFLHRFLKEGYDVLVNEDPQSRIAALRPFYASLIGVNYTQGMDISLNITKNLGYKRTFYEAWAYLTYEMFFELGEYHTPGILILPYSL